MAGSQQEDEKMVAQRLDRLHAVVWGWLGASGTRRWGFGRM